MAKPQVLLIEDSDLDARLIQSALNTSAPELEIRRARDGQSGLDEIKDGKPAMVLLDLSMPGLDGFEVLDRIRAGENSQTLPVVICSNSEATADVATGYEKLANAYVVKPDTANGYTELAESLRRFWFEHAKLP